MRRRVEPDRRSASGRVVVLGLAAFALVGVACRPAARQVAPAVVLVTIDGVRWQEVFGGLDESLLGGDRESAAVLGERFGGGSREERRLRLMPFFWQTVAEHGQIFGDRASGGSVRVTNALNFSYPGYQELLAGFPDPRIDSNDKRGNPNRTVLEWLASRPGFADRVVAFGSWDVFPFILAEDRSGVSVNAGWEPTGSDDPALAMLDLLQADTTREWESVRFDSFTFHAALAALQEQRPRALYLALGEPDDWAHEGRYDRYVLTINRADDFLRRLWQALENDPAYGHSTTLVVTTDHGRGDTTEDWTDHGRDVAGSEYAWAAVLGPHTAALGVRDDQVTLAQIAATVAAALGEGYAEAVPESAPPLPGAVQ